MVARILETRTIGTGEAPSCRLTCIGQRQSGIVTSIELEPADAAYLRAMGLCLNARVRVCRVGNPCVVAVGGTEGGRCRCGGRCRIGLSSRLASGIWIAPSTDAPLSPHHRQP